MNVTVLTGRLVKELELKKTSTNKSVVAFTIACDKWSKEGNSADFINCVAWNQTAEYLCKYGYKGALIALKGRISTRTYQGQTNKVFVTEVIADELNILSRKNGTSRNEETETEQPNSDEVDFNKIPQLEVEADELPFY